VVPVVAFQPDIEIQMFDVTTDVRENKLSLTLAGRMDRAELEQAAAATVEAAESLHEGFVIVNDISEFRPPSPEAAKPIKEAQARLRELGMNGAIRIVGEDPNPVVANAFDRRSRDVGYEGDTVQTEREARQVFAKRFA
jgi:hypothetical protein